MKEIIAYDTNHMHTRALTTQLSGTNAIAFADDTAVLPIRPVLATGPIIDREEIKTDSDQILASIARSLKHSALLNVKTNSRTMKN